MAGHNASDQRRDLQLNLHDYNLAYTNAPVSTQTMPTRRSILSATTLPLLPTQSASATPGLTRFVDYAVCSERTAAVYVRRDKAERAMWARGDDRCAVLQACDAELVPLWDDMNAIIRRSVTSPARDLVEVASKMLVWRAETALLGARLETARDVAAFGAYQDVLRLAGLAHLAHALDERTHAKALLWDGE